MEVWNVNSQLQWLRDAKRSLKHYFDIWYADDTDDPFVTLLPASPLSTKHEKGHYDQGARSRRQRAVHSGGDLERYYALGAQDIDHPLQWWLDHRGTFPRLSRLALDIFAIPSMAANCERAFSGAKLTMTSQRQSMQPETLEPLQCMKNWLRHGNIRLVSMLISPGRRNGDERLGEE